MSNQLAAQCPGCAVDPACVVSPPYPTLCPSTPEPATAGEAYVADFTFWMPASFTDPGSGFTVDFTQMTITGISGLPFGLEFEPSEPSGVYYPLEDPFGCARVCGTPLGAGVFTITISILAAVEYQGFPISVPQQFLVVLTVLPNSGGNTSFSYAPTSGCGPLSVQLEAQIDATPAPMTYAWEFGNGTISDVAQPPVQIYSEPGTYSITLQTTIGGYILNTVDLTGVNGNWCGDVEEPDVPFVGCSGTPDPYFVLTDADGGTITSGTVDDSFTASWGDLGIVLDNAPYSISFYDEDVVSTNDLLGTFNIPANSSGTLFINIAGGTTGSLDLSIVPIQLFSDTDTVVVFPSPEVVLLEDSLSGALCVPGDTLISYTWFLDGDTVSEATGPCYTPTGSGRWQVIGTNGFGCSAISDTIVICPEFDIVRNDDVLFVPSGYLSYSWTHDSIPIAGNDPFIFTEGDGLYDVTVDAGNGCLIVEEYLLITTGGADLRGNEARMTAFPMPNDGHFVVVAGGLAGDKVLIELVDPGGRRIMRRTERVTRGTLRIELAVDAPSGAYSLRLQDEQRTWTRRIIIVRGR